MFRYNRTIIGIGMSLIACYLLGCCSLSAFADTDNRPEQKRTELTVSETSLTSFSDGVPCLRMKVVVQPSQFAGHIPTKIVLTTVLNETLHSNWQLFNASWAATSNPRTLEEATVQLFEEPPQLGTPVDAVFDGIKHSEATYILNLDLRPIERDESIGNEYSGATNDQSRAKLAEKLRQKFKDVYKASADEIVNRRGVRIWLKDAE